MIRIRGVMSTRLVICADSALDVCGKLAVAGCKAATPSRAKTLNGCVSAKRAIAKFDFANLPVEISSAGRKLHVLVDGNNSRFCSKTIARHTWNGVLPPGSLYKIGPEVYMTSPEFSLLLISQKCGFNDLVMRCCEVCGTYGIDGGGKGFYERSALTSIAKVRAFLDKAGSVRGALKLRRALKYAFDNARSPMEAAIALLMCYPVRMGGFGFPKPILNYRMDLNREASRMAGRSFVLFDYFFPEQHVALEYDSNQEHTGANRIASDARRNNTLRYMGISVTNITWTQVRDPLAFEYVMKQVAKLLNKKLAVFSDQARIKRMQLRADVLPRVSDR